jgi:sigma-B regulation protein RsbU (phosphoserine phosphatase)
LPVGVPLGVTPGTKRTSAAVQLDDGAALLLYTDGLIERRGEVLDEGLERLRSHFRPDPPQLLCTTLLRTLFGSQAPSDDVALVVVRRTSEPSGTST